MPRRITRTDKFRLLLIFCFRSHYSIHQFPWDGICRSRLACVNCTGWSGSIHYADTLYWFSRGTALTILCEASLAMWGLDPFPLTAHIKADIKTEIWIISKNISRIIQSKWKHYDKRNKKAHYFSYMSSKGVCILHVRMRPYVGNG